MQPTLTALPAGLDQHIVRLLTTTLSDQRLRPRHIADIQEIVTRLALLNTAGPFNVRSANRCGGPTNSGFVTAVSPNHGGSATETGLRAGRKTAVRRVRDRNFVGFEKHTDGPEANIENACLNTVD